MSRPTAVTPGAGRHSGFEDRSSPTRRPVLALSFSVVSAGLWGWASGSLLVAGLTLFTAAAQALLAQPTPRRIWEAMWVPLWIGLTWAAVDAVWARLGIGNWGRLGS